MNKLFVLQRQPVGEHQFLLDIFSAEQGRLSVVTPKRKYSKTHQSNLYIPDLFQLCQADWRSGDEWPNIKASEMIQQFTLQGNYLYCGLYLNELLSRLLTRQDAQPELFRIYQQIVKGLQNASDDATSAEPLLRIFEHQVLQQLGYGVDWQQDNQQRPVYAGQRYFFNAREGFYRHGEGKFSGQDILAFYHWLNDFTQVPASARVWQCAKQVLRLALEEHFDRPLVSRELFMAQLL
ncbi:DNA repair protein RecO [Bacterioplanoides sp. SCSIO 12839]|uniref:DNA repair protein RecO n=1 Tax=Bacterioplanoides sp. SCSIO 12839 TaxID=2829569 RepID=UPI002102D443|nr:DNA repair protein RecO [Bacterioplanoides sp. SCSIO 12839]UTW47245.1 DNA repair protein RecO [Bacterioplanoides sp. SCSIO 12839]